MKNHSTLIRLTTIAFLVALDIILGRFCSISTPIARIGFGFIPASLLGFLFGPLVGGLGCAVADILGTFLFPTGAYFPGITLTSFFAGALYGLILHNRPISWLRSLTAAFCVCTTQLLLNSFWLSIITDTSLAALLSVRFIKSAVMVPVITMGIELLYPRLIPIAKKHLSNY